MDKILLIYSYYIVWFGSLILSANNYSWLPLLFSVSISAIQLYFWCNLPKIHNWGTFLLSLTLLGYGMDCIFTLTSFIYFHANPLHPYFAPPWMLGLWINFSVLCIGLVEFLKNLNRYLPLFALLGFPAAYMGGIGFHVATFNLGIASCLIIGLIWMILFPLLCRSILFRYSLPNKDE